MTQLERNFSKFKSGAIIRCSDSSINNDNEENFEMNGIKEYTKFVEYHEEYKSKEINSNCSKFGLKSIQTINILLADDNLFNLMILKNLLKSINEFKFKIH